MTFFDRLFHKPSPLPHVIVRHVAATADENRAVRRKREETTAALRRYVTERELVRAVEAAICPPLAIQRKRG